jgi:LEA14-like dessication related protein
MGPAAVLVAALAGGCSSVPQPEARLKHVWLEGIGLDSAALTFDVEVTNPYPLPLPLVDVDYSLASQARPFMDGRADLAGAIPAGSRKTLSFPVRVKYAELLETVRGIRPGQVVPYAAKLGLSVDAPAVGAVRLPIQAEGKLPVPAPPQLALTRVEWSEVGLSKAAGQVHLQLTNRNEFPLQLKGLQYEIALAGKRVTDGRLAAGPQLLPGKTGELVLPVSVSPKNVGLALLKVIRSREAAYRFEGRLTAETPYGRLGMPLSTTGNVAMKR